MDPELLKNPINIVAPRYRLAQEWSIQMCLGTVEWRYIHDDKTVAQIPHAQAGYIVIGEWTNDNDYARLAYLIQRLKGRGVTEVPVQKFHDLAEWRRQQRAAVPRG